MGERKQIMPLIQSFGSDFIGGGAGGSAASPSILYSVFYSGFDIAYLGGDREGVQKLTTLPTTCDNNFAVGEDWETPADVLALDPLPELPSGFCIIQHVISGTLYFAVNYKVGVNYDYFLDTIILSGAARS